MKIEPTIIKPHYSKKLLKEVDDLECMLYPYAKDGTTFKITDSTERLFNRHVRVLLRQRGIVVRKVRNSDSFRVDLFNRSCETCNFYIWNDVDVIYKECTNPKTNCMGNLKNFPFRNGCKYFKSVGGTT